MKNRNKNMAFKVIFMADDHIISWVLPFLESFREFNRDTSLVMIPLSDSCQQLSQLQDVYQFSILNYNFHRLDELASLIYGDIDTKYKNRVRKLAAFDIQNSVINYIDPNSVVLFSLERFSQKVFDDEADLIYISGNNDSLVYKSEYQSIDLLKKSHRFNDGFFMANTNKLSTHQAIELIENNLQILQSIRSNNAYSPPIINFAVDSAGIVLKSITDLYDDVSSDCWYAQKSILEYKGSLYSANKPVVYLSWAGPIKCDDDFRFKPLYNKFYSRASERLEDHHLTSLIHSPMKKQNEFILSGSNQKSDRYGNDYLDEFNRILEQYLPNDVNAVLEWGAGNTTLELISFLDKKQCNLFVTIDDNKNYLDSVTASFSDRHYLKAICANRIGPCNNQSDIGLNYSSHPLQYKLKFDFIFIDGRRRMECSLIAAFLSHEETVIVIHDYRRERYQTVKLLFDIIEDGPQFRIMKVRRSVFQSFSQVDLAISAQ